MSDSTDTMPAVQSAQKIPSQTEMAAVSLSPVTRAEFVDRVGKLETDMQDIKPRIVSVEGKTAAVVADVTALKDDVKAIKNDVAAVKDDTTKQTASLVRIETAIVGLATKVGTAIDSPDLRFILKAIGVALALAIAAWLTGHGIKVEIPSK